MKILQLYCNSNQAEKLDYRIDSLLKHKQFMNEELEKLQTTISDLILENQDLKRKIERLKNALDKKWEIKCLSSKSKKLYYIINQQKEY